jgi:hypothetical protein
MTTCGNYMESEMSTKMTIKEVREWRDKHFGYGPYHHYDVCDFAISQHEELERLRAELAEREAQLAGCSDLLDQAYQILDGYGNLDTYRAERTGGVLAGCPRGEVPTPDKLIMPARIFCNRLKEAVASLPVSAKHNAEILRAAESHYTRHRVETCKICQAVSAKKAWE